MTGELYRETLAKKGGVAAKLVAGLLIGYAVLNFVAFLLLTFFP